ncbi:hypothetical protein PVAND_006720 [Polypedilum vanderplanki]|uniref:Globin n=1 Tax=Polypedilum vanderplanki TaxID=319348 RepID=S6B7V9_POLVA|nr:hypothetical protein PVAND_006720 [Polypedilum vanderplanki]BAN67588.1 globin [Polypedilum vanderplanki]
MKFFVLSLFFAVVIAGPLWMEANDVSLIRHSWDKVKTNEVEILYLIFKENPSIQAKFAAFAGKDLETLKGTAPFAEHANRIISLINRYIDLLGDDGNDATIKAILEEMGEKHAARGVTKDQFEAFKVTVLNYLKSHVEWNDALGKAWDTAFDKMYSIVFTKLH